MSTATQPWLFLARNFLQEQTLMQYSCALAKEIKGTDSSLTEPGVCQALWQVSGQRNKRDFTGGEMFSQRNTDQESSKLLVHQCLLTGKGGIKYYF